MYVALFFICRFKKCPRYEENPFFLQAIGSLITYAFGFSNDSNRNSPFFAALSYRWKETWICKRSSLFQFSIQTTNALMIISFKNMSYLRCIINCTCLILMIRIKMILLTSVHTPCCGQLHAYLLNQQSLLPY